MEKQARKITVEEAIALLPEGDDIHTFRGGGMMLMGADHSRESLIESFTELKDTLQIGGEQCRAMKHGLVLEDSAGFLFIETDPEKLDIFDPL